MKIAVLGSGAWGTALALLLQKNGNEVTLWSYCEEESRALRERGENKMLPDIPLPPALRLTHREEAVRGCELVVFAPPSYAMRQTAERVKPYLTAGTILVTVAKGVEPQSGLRMSQILNEVLPEFSVGGAFGSLPRGGGGAGDAHRLCGGVPRKSGCRAGAGSLYEPVLPCLQQHRCDRCGAVRRGEEYYSAGGGHGGGHGLR